MSFSNDDFNKVHPISVIQSILHGYPFGVGIFREFLQNSDDARASRQIFLLDNRRHPTDAIYHDRLKNTQGPALIAYNDASFREPDWDALQTMYQSSKKIDTSKIGKYGIGFRSCYHITDFPQVLSDNSFLMLDPLNCFTAKGGRRIHLSEVPGDHERSLNLDWFKSLSNRTGPFAGTIIRLPLRTDGSEISTKSVTPPEIFRLLEEFVKGEIDVVLLFLANLLSIEIYTINECDQIPQLMASANVLHSGESVTSCMKTWIRRIRTTLRDRVIQSQWRVLHLSFDNSECSNMLSKRLGSDAQSDIVNEKLTPDIALAITLPVSEASYGRLFTYLPLPIPTGYPCHIHGLFSLDQSRQNLRNIHENGLVPGFSDSIRVEWNRFLFDTLIPRAWLKLLSVLVEQDNMPANGIFHAWPHSQSNFLDWQCVPAKLLDEVICTKEAVWPVLPYLPDGSTPKYFSLDDVLVTPEEAQCSTSSDQLMSLASVGIRITQLPQHIYNLISGNKFVTYLTPISARECLLEHTDELTRLPKVNLDHILSYLLSSARLDAIIGLPLVLQVDGRTIALSKLSHGCTLHVLLDAHAQSVFSWLDSSAIAVAHLPPVAKDLFLREGEGLLNIKLLSCDAVMKYLELAFRELRIGSVYSTTTNISHLPPKTLQWFVGFWAWLALWTSRKAIYRSLEPLPLLPTSMSSLLYPRDGIFLSDPPDQLCKLLQSIGVPFLHSSVDQAVQAYLQEQGAIRRTSSVPDLLRHIRPNNVTLLRGFEILRLRGHLVASSVSLSDDDRRTLRRLPIFSRLSPNPTEQSRDHVIRSLESIADNEDLKCVPEHIILPFIPQVFYTSDLPSARLITPYIQRLSEVDILQKAVENFPGQPEEWQYKFLVRICDIRHEIPHRLLQDLRRCRFIRTGDELRSPADIFDTTSSIAGLFLPNDHRLPPPQMRKYLIDALRRLGLFNCELTIDLCRERIFFVAGRSRSIDDRMAIAEKLLDAMDASGFLEMDYSSLHDHINLAWLPTNRGLYSPNCCRDKRDEILCKDVWPLLASGREIRSTALRNAFGWNDRVPLPVIVNRFQHVLAGDYARSHSTSDFHKLILEFGSRLHELGDEVIRELTVCTNNMSWIPISGSSDALSSAMFAVFSVQDALPHFHRIRTSLVNNRGSRKFLERMGCTEEPSTQAILRAIQSCNGSVRQIVTLLRALRPEELTGAERTVKFVPDSNGTLYAPTELLYNDLGTNATKVSIPETAAFSHKDVDYDTAILLGLRLLSSLEIQEGDEDDDDEDMHEDLTERISGVLLQYTKEQAFLEFLANAADAKATKFGIYLDQMTRRSQVSSFLTPAMGQLQQGASLIIYNDGVFSKKDWKGIRRVGTGGKRMENEEGNTNNRDATIGRFGLGALSMFHFTEVAMIVSGNQVMFLDPTKRYADGTKTKSCVKIPLATMNRLFPDHLSPLQGIFGFSADNNYNGTIFQLPLRTERQASKERAPISTDWHDPPKIQALIWDFYHRFASSALLFIQVREAHAMQCSHEGLESTLWSVAATERKVVGTQQDDSIEEVTIRRSEDRSLVIQERWQVLVENTPRSSIPESHHAAMSKARINGVSIGIAGLLPLEHQENMRYRVFFGVPTSTTTSLPVHLHGSFILSEDRRSVRFEDDGDANPESRYNRWLLREKIPPLYLRFLEAWPIDKKIKKSKWWPRLNPTDIISRTITEAIRCLFITSKRLVCDSLAGTRISPAHCIFVPTTRHVGVTKVLRLIELPDVAECIAFIWSAELREVDGRHLAQVLQNYEDDFRSLFSTGRLDVSDVVDVVRFLVEGGEKQLLIGLPLLPLVTGNLAVFAEAHSASEVYTWAPSRGPVLPWTLFGPDHFLHPDADTELMVEQSLNVTALMEDAVIRFIELRLQRVDEVAMTPKDQKWIQDLWSILLHLRVKKETLSGFPLIPTYPEQQKDFPTTYLSFQRCENADVILFTNEDDLPHLRLLQRLGANFVKIGACSVLLQHFLSDFKYSFETVLEFFGTIVQEDITGRFRQLRGLEHTTFVEWIRYGLQSIPDPNHVCSQRYPAALHLREISAKLPVWEVIQGERGWFVDALAAAEEIVMLPPWVKLSTAQEFLRTSYGPYAEYSETLSKLQVSKLDTTEFRSLLEFPRMMPTISNAYINLLRGLVFHSSVPDAIQVPNANGRMVLSRSLYSRSEALFHEVFSTPQQQYNLLHPSLTELETSLTRFGLRSELDFDSFRAVAIAVDEEAEGPDKVRRAALAYGAYSNRLYGCILGNATLWAMLDNLRFIPRNALRRRSHISTTSFEQFAKPFAEVVSPAELLTTSLEPMAWTQRALFLVEPSQQLSISYPSLGQPTAKEVILHLQVLARDIAPHHPFDPQLISDLQATYRWLDKKAKESDVKNLLDCHGEAWFLNVDDPTKEWNWEPAPNIIFNAPDEGIRRSVKGFLVGYKSLLLSSGAHEIRGVAAPTNIQFTQTEETLANLRMGFVEMRNDAKLTDVIFETRDGKELLAHRVFLAAQSDYFRGLFAGHFREAQLAPIRVSDYAEFDPMSLEIALDYMYTGNIPEDLDYEQLVCTFQLSHYFNLRDLNLRVQLKLIIDFITPDNYRHLLELSQELEEKCPLAVACEEYAEVNSVTLEELGR